jgi:16S rRNA (uracil1498-N3)-methyltransferase
MSTPWFHVSPLEPGEVRLSVTESRHARAARRLAVGDEVVLFDGAGRTARGHISRIAPPAVEITAGEPVHCERPRPRLALAVAVPKGPRQDTMIEKCAELGVASIQPLLAERGVAGASEHRQARWRRTTIEAAKQSRQAWLPELLPPASVSEASETVTPGALCAVAATEWGRDEANSGGAIEPGPPPWSVERWIEAVRGRDEVAAFVGPEGGWTGEELQGLLQAGAFPLCLGPNILRIETAAIALAAIVHGLQNQQGGDRNP